MLIVSQLSKSYGIQTVLSNISFTLNAGERVGLIGPNGCGKSTLLRILAGEEKADHGNFQYASHTSLGYLSQGFVFSPAETIGSYIARQEGDIEILSDQLAQLAVLLTQLDQPDLREKYDLILEQIQRAAESDGRGAAILANLGLSHFPKETPVSVLSGGQKTRLALAGLLVAAPNLLLLDEPTNHLDIQMLEWLEDWLEDFRGAALIVSHDRAFLDRTVTEILELSDQTHTITPYPGNYSDYLEAKIAARERQWQEFTDQQIEISHLRASARHIRSLTVMRKGGKADSGDKFAKGFFANRALETARRAKALEHRLERLMTTDRVEKPSQSWELKIEFGELPETGKDVIVLENLTAGYPDISLLENLALTVRAGQRIALIGPNGCGKTTLLRTIAGRIAPLAGSVRIGTNVHLGYMAQEQENLPPAGSPLSALLDLTGRSETEVRRFLSYFLFMGEDVFTPISSLSFGERTRLSLACFVAQGCNVLLLDEPINHLDIPARTRFEQALNNFQGTILAVVHDRYFIHAFASQIWEVSDRKIYAREHRQEITTL